MTTPDRRGDAREPDDTPVTEDDVEAPPDLDGAGGQGGTPGPDAAEAHDASDPHDAPDLDDAPEHRDTAGPDEAPGADDAPGRGGPAEPDEVPEHGDPVEAHEAPGHDRPGERDDAADAEHAPGHVPEPDETLTSDGGHQPSGWRVLARALRPRATRAQLLAGVLCAALGFALVVQVRQTSDADLAGLRQADLVRILDETTTRGEALAREAADLQRERDELISGSDRRQAALDALQRAAETQGILTGRLPAQGPGIVVTLTEPDGAITPVTMLNLLEELRNAGAEAIELNGQRITASSAFTGTPGAVEVDGTALSAPYRWTAIGDPDTMATALQIPGGAMTAVRSNGGQGTIDRQDVLEITALRALPDPVYATPVPPQEG